MSWEGFPRSVYITWPNKKIHFLNTVTNEFNKLYCFSKEFDMKTKKWIEETVLFIFYQFLSNTLSGTWNLFFPSELLKKKQMISLFLVWEAKVKEVDQL